jgi:ABC-2 type transport system permease protein
MLEELRELYRFRELLISMVQRELRIRYKNSALGFLWSFLNPLVTTLVMTVVFGGILNNGVKNFSAYVLAAYLPFMFFQFAVLDSSQSVLAALPIVKKVYFPREILPLAGMVSNFIHLLLGFVVFFGFLLVAYIRDPAVFPFQASTVYLPLLLLISAMLALGFGFIVSALNTFYEDVKYIAGIALYLLFFLCPVMYFVEGVASSSWNEQTNGLVYKLYMLNPMAVLCVAYRKILLAPVKVPIIGKAGLSEPLPMPWDYLGYVFVFSLGLLFFGYWLFNHLKWKFVERP